MFDQLRGQAERWNSEGRRIVVAAWTRGSRERLTNLLREHGFKDIAQEDAWASIRRKPAGSVSLVVLGVERGFVAERLALVGEQDLLGERISRPPRRRKRADQFIAEATEIAEGDLVVHQEYGIGRYDGLATLRVTGAPHDCLRLIYDGNEKLFLPVENIEVLSRYGSEHQGTALDKLGGAGWQTRKARMKQRIRDMAGELIRIAADPKNARRRDHGAPRRHLGRILLALPLRRDRRPVPRHRRRAGGPRRRQTHGSPDLRRRRLWQDRGRASGGICGGNVRDRRSPSSFPQRLLARQHFRTFSVRALPACPSRSPSCRAWSPPRKPTEVRKGVVQRRYRHRRRHPRAAGKIGGRSPTSAC